MHGAVVRGFSEILLCVQFSCMLQSVINLTLVTIGVDTYIYICICKDAVWCGLWR